MQHGVVCLPLPANPLKSGSRTSPEPVRRGAPISQVFFIGPENSLLVSTIDSLLTSECSPYNPLVLCGIPSSGKSHLVSGIAARWQQQHSNHAIICTGATEFARTYAQAVEDDAVQDLRNQYTSAQLVILEDLTQLTGKTAAQRELALMLDHWLACGTQVIITSKVNPEQIANFPLRLISRLSSGLVLPLVLPESLARIAILERTASDRSIQIEATAVKLLGEHLHGTVPELTAALLELELARRTDKSIKAAQITSQQVRKYLGQRNPHQPTLRSIVALAAKYFGLKVADLTSPSRRRAVVTARSISIYLARDLTEKSLEQIGKHLGRRDHTTVLHSYRNVEKQLRTDPEIQRAITELRSLLINV